MSIRARVGVIASLDPNKPRVIIYRYFKVFTDFGPGRDKLGYLSVGVVQSRIYVTAHEFDDVPLNKGRD